MEGQGWHSLSSHGLPSVPTAQRHFHHGALRLPGTLSTPSLHMPMPQRTEQVQCTWSSMISHRPITPRVAVQQLPRSTASHGMAWNGSRLPVQLFQEPSEQPGISEQLCWAGGNWGRARSCCAELMCLLQESRNESHIRQMSWELTGNILLATWPRGQLQLCRNYSQPEKHLGMLVVIF